MSITIRRASDVDIASATEIIQQRTQWLREKGTDQWSTREQTAVLAEAYQSGHTWVVCDTAGDVLGTFSLTEEAPVYWAAEAVVPGLYLYKMATARDVAGRGIGRRIIQASADIAAHRGLKKVRWDAWTTNRDLHAYYDAVPGTRRVRVVDGLVSGQLFELDVPASVTDMTDTTIQF